MMSCYWNRGCAQQSQEKPRLDLIGLSLGILVLAGLFFVYFPTLAQIANICWTDENYSHGLLLPFISCYLALKKLRQMRRLQQTPPLREVVSIQTYRTSFLEQGTAIIGMITLLTGVFLFYIGHLGHSLFLCWVSFFSTIAGSMFLILEFQLTTALLPIILLNFMAKPLPDSLTPKLFGPFQDLTARLGAFILDLLHVPVHLLGNVIEIPGMDLLVEEACSGMRSVITMLTVALVTLLLLEMSLIAQGLLLFFAIIIAIAMNVFRVVATGLLAYFYSHQAAIGFFHAFSGLCVFWLGLLLLTWCGNRLRSLPNYQPPCAGV